MIAVSLLLCLLSVFGCFQSRETTIKEDLTQYLEQARAWGETETQINTAIAQVQRDQFVHDDFIVQTLKPALEITQQHVQDLENYHPRTPPLYNVHQEYTEAWRAHYFALAAVVDAVEKKDYIQLAAAKDDLLEARRSVADALGDLGRLLREAELRQEPQLGEQLPAPPAASFGKTVS